MKHKKGNCYSDLLTRPVAVGFNNMRTFTQQGVNQ